MGPFQPPPQILSFQYPLLSRSETYSTDAYANDCWLRRLALLVGHVVDSNGLFDVRYEIISKCLCFLCCVKEMMLKS